MKKKLLQHLILTALVVFSASTLSKTPPVTESTLSLQFLGEKSISTQTRFKDIPVGGLSGIYYDNKKQIYTAISDSRNTPMEGMSRIYTFKIDTSLNGIGNISVVDMHNLLDAEGNPWKKGVVDAEGIAPTPNGNGFYWSSELGSGLRITDPNGKFIADLDNSIPEYFSTKTQGEKDAPIGLRYGLSFEGLSLTPDSKTLFIGTETALKQDAPIAGTMNSSPTRILKYQVNPLDNSLTMAGEYVYNLDAIPQVSKFGISDNGLSEILAISDKKLLIVERAGRNASKGYDDWDFNVRVYLVDLEGSTDIQGTYSLKDIDPKTLQTAQKRLLIDFNLLTDKPDCIEGMTFGPTIDGKKSLVFVSDNNFQPYQSNKFYLFLDKNGLLN